LRLSGADRALSGRRPEAEAIGMSTAQLGMTAPPAVVPELCPRCGWGQLQADGAKAALYHCGHMFDRAADGSLIVPDVRAPNGHASVAHVADSRGRGATASAGHGVLDELHRFLGRFVAYPSPHARVAHTLWIAHAHLMDAWESTPRIAFLSPEPASGKTRALELTELLVPRPVEAVNVTPAYLFRKVGDESGPPTILYHEIDTVFGPKAKESEEIRGLLNAGHRRGAVAGRCVVRGKTVTTEEIPAYCAVALAGLGGLPDTILSRAIHVRMRRRAPGERVDAYRRRVHAPEGHAIRDRLAGWCDTVRDALKGAWPAMPDGVEDRDSDLWEPLLAVADAAGGAWPECARAACVALVAESRESTPSLGIRLLGDLREVFGDSDLMATEGILSALHALDEAPWAELVAGKPLNARGLAQRLRQYGVARKNVRIGDTVTKGYAREDLADAWSRYLPAAATESATSATRLQRDRVGETEDTDRMADVAYDDAEEAIPW
jgi:hypothetical protein